ncbi:MAG: nucleoside triphosphate pyrophosphohydrolase family protein [Cyanobacteria bacterium REEB65]|nr:nucleoside triphosphate pyrophosphohydrolase family protein [Cyanobacteria bacterium REEB65]
MINPDLDYGEEGIAIALGLAGEAGEYADLIKKHVAQGHPLDTEKAIEELGDLLFYVAWGCIHYGVTLSDVIGWNESKLNRRYPHGFTVEASIAREDRRLEVVR